MLSYTSTIDIDAPIERIWPALIDVQRWPQWTPTTTRVEPINDAPFGAGARYKIFQPKLRPAIWEVTMVDPSKGFAWESRQAGIRVIAEHLLVESRTAQTSRTQLTLRVIFSGLLSGIAGRLGGKLTQRYLSQECAGLKQYVESTVR